MTLSFIHLSVHTEFSLIDSTVRIKKLAEEVAKTMPAVAVTDRDNLFALVKFYRAALHQGIKPLAGADVRISSDDPEESPSRALLLVQSDVGYQHLTRLISKGYLEGQKTHEPVLERNWFEEHNEGLIMLSGGVEGDVAQALKRGHEDQASDRARFWQALFGDRFYLEITRTGRAFEEAYIRQACLIGSSQSIPLVATNDVRFLHKDDFSAHETRLCIQGSYVLADPKRPKHVTEEQYLKTPEQMAALFKDIPSALQNSVEIAKRCNMSLALGQPVLPDFPIPTGYTETEFFIEASKEGLEARLAVLFDKSADNFHQLREPYDERLERELNVIAQMGFSGYFLIVADFIRWSRDNEIPVGPGRGSGAGSVVAYALGITDIDPLAYDLLFERFLNPERVSMPDFDIDFCMDGRDRVIQYVSQKYGSQRVSQIITYGTMAARAVVRDVGRVMGQSYGFVDRIAKMVPNDIGMTLEKAMIESEDLQKAYRDEEEVTNILDMAFALEGLARNCGKHAGGVVIAPTALTDFAPLYCEADGSGLVTQFDKDDAESVGLVKFDFLGLRTLTIIDNAVKEINKTTAEPLDITLLPLDDEPTYKLMQKASTTAVFQLESPGMKRLIERLQPNNFEDIIALVALYRPGPLQSGMVDDFIDRKHGRKKLAWPHENYQLDSLKPVLEPTYGVILYQEQVMKIAQVMAGYSLGTADILRRAMGKKKPEEMRKQRTVFLDGCVANDIDKDLAGNIFDLVEKFAGYGFNKSHSAAYALLSYQTAWLKQHYPAAFMSAVLSADMDNTDKVVVLIDECKTIGLKVVPPDINQSAVRFTVLDDQTVLYGLGAIKGVGEAALASVLAERDNHGPFANLDELCRRADPGTVNKRVLEALVKSGAADALGPNRATLWEHLPKALQGAEQMHRDQAAGQVDLFGLAASAEVVDSTADVLVRVEEWQERERLRAEKETLGLYLSGHPITAHLDELAKISHGRLKVLCAKAGGDSGQPSWRQRGVPVVAAGLIIGIRFRDFQGGKMGFVTLDDQSGRVEVTLRGDVLEASGHLLKSDEVLVVDGDISTDDFNGGYKIRAKEIYSLESARSRFARRLVINLSANQWRDRGLDELIRTLASYSSGSTPVLFEYDNGQAKVTIQAGKGWRVHPKHELLDDLSKLTGENSVELIY
ncbi:MAG: DNA polymerase III subunit alpha [Gammaproteobacteria bacterium]|nr:DNA polymerase III subunit alpha [Gammaproteobacteria bacterium]